MYVLTYLLTYLLVDWLEQWLGDVAVITLDLRSEGRWFNQARPLH